MEKRPPCFGRRPPLLRRNDDRPGLYLFPYDLENRLYARLIYVLACAVAVGAAARIYVRITYGNPGTAGTIAVVIESVLPIFLIILTYLVSKKDARKA